MPPPDGGTDAATEDSGPTAPPNTVIGRRYTRCHQLPADVDVPDDLSTSTVEALIPDNAPSGYRVQKGVGRADGTFLIEGVPDGAAYVLRINTDYYATDQHVVDFRFEQTGRCVPAPVLASASTPVTVELTGMTPFAASGDFVEIRSSMTGYSSFAVSETASAGDTAIQGTVDWGVDSPLVDAAAGDDLSVLHVRNGPAPAPDAAQRGFTTKIVDAFSATGTTVRDGVAVRISGAFQPVASDHRMSVSLDRTAFEAGFDPVTSTSGGIVARVYAAPATPSFADSVVSYLLLDTAVSKNRLQVIDDTYGDPFPASWPRMLDLEYILARGTAAPGKTNTGSLTFSMGERQIRPYTGAVEPLPAMHPPSDIRIAGQDFGSGGTIPFDGEAPVEIRWDPVPSASSYRLIVQIWAVRPDFPKAGLLLRTAAVFFTAGTSIRIPATVFRSESFYMFLLDAIAAPNDYRGGHLIPPLAPIQAVTIQSGRFRFSATCGDGVVQSGEDCDTAGASATCNVDCTVSACGDGMYNPAAGEACDAASDSQACDRNCTPAVCGDGYINFNFERCDDGNAIDDGNGCSADCKINAVCGNRIVERLTETCDDGGVDTATCDADCTVVFCGDRHVNPAAGEDCDDGPAGSETCSPTCKRLPPPQGWRHGSSSAGGTRLDASL